MTRLQAHIHALQTARRMTTGLLEGLAERHGLHQPVAGGQHALWIVGHLALADDWGLVSLGSARRLASMDRFFAGSAPIAADASAYPPVEEAMRCLESAHEGLITRLGEIDEADLDRMTSGPIAAFAPDLATLLMSHVWHEGFHTGQLALIRRSLGLAVRWG